MRAHTKASAFLATSLGLALGALGCSKTTKDASVKDGAVASSTTAATGTVKSSALDALPTTLAPATFKELDLFQDGDLGRPKQPVRAFNVKVSLWADGAYKQRFISLPPGTTIHFNETTKTYAYPVGTALVKHFTRGANGERPIETRVITLLDTLKWQYATYQWLDDGTTVRLDKAVVVKGATPTEPDYRIPSPDDCKSCHTADANTILGFKPEQLGGSPGESATPLATLHKLGIFDGPLEPMAAVATVPDPRDETMSADQRARAYMALNCASCHYPRGTASILDLSATMDEGQLVQDGFITPGDVSKSKIWTKFTAPKYRMPPTSTVQDPLGLAIFKAWIEQFPAAK